MDKLCLGARVGGALIGFECVRLARPREAPRYLTERLQGLGPTFVKLAQFASTRKDVLPQPYIDAFRSLHSDVRPDGVEETRKNLTARLGVPPEEFFDSFDPVPIACGSVAQVHRAVYRGRSAAVKVIKLGVEGMVAAETSVLLSMAGLVDDGGSLDCRSTLDQYAATLREEMDLVREARMTKRASRMILYSEIDAAVPLPLHASPRGVLVMEYLPSRGLLESGGGAELSGVIMDAVLYQIFAAGPFNCDPHEGNMGVAADGRLVLYDFDNCLALSDEFMRALMDVAVAFQTRDADRVLSGLVRHSMVRANTEEERDMLRSLVEQSFRYMRSMSVSDFDPETFRDGSSRVSRELYSISRTILMTDGVCKSLCPDFNLERAINHFLERFLVEIVVRRGVSDLARLVGGGGGGGGSG